MEKENETTIYIPLLNEGINVWRPVQAKQLGTDVFKITSINDDETEEWQFNYGERVRCTHKKLNEGTHLVATEKFI